MGHDASRSGPRLWGVSLPHDFDCALGRTGGLIMIHGNQVWKPVVCRPCRTWSQKPRRKGGQPTREIGGGAGFRQGVEVAEVPAEHKFVTVS